MFRDNRLFVVTVSWDQDIVSVGANEVVYTGQRRRNTDTWSVLCRLKDQAIAETEHKYKDRNPVIVGVESHEINQFLIEP